MSPEALAERKRCQAPHLDRIREAPRLRILQDRRITGHSSPKRWYLVFYCYSYCLVLFYFVLFCFMFVVVVLL